MGKKRKGCISPTFIEGCPKAWLLLDEDELL